MTDNEKPTGNTFNVSSYSQTGGITAGQISFGAPQRHLDAEGEKWLSENVPLDGPPVEITAMTGDTETYMFAREIEVFLRARGYNVRGIGSMTSQPPAFGVFLNPQSDWTNLVVGHRG